MVATEYHRNCISFRHTSSTTIYENSATPDASDVWSAYNFIFGLMKEFLPRIKHKEIFFTELLNILGIS